MKPSFTFLSIAIIISLFVFGCSSQQIYTIGQASQRLQCDKIADQDTRNQCISNSGTSYDSYKYQTEDHKK